jgi:glycosyltransferase involved in cell wall biosynthesis
MRLALNGRFLSQRVTGVQRHARELVRALDRRLDRGSDAGRRLEVTLLVPPDARLDLDLSRISVQRVGHLRGQAWEQLDLPRHSRGQLLLSLCNTGPALVRRQLLTIHDASVFAVPEAYSAAFRRYYRLLLPFLARRVERVLTVSRFSATELERWIGISEEKIRITPGGHDHILATAADPNVLRRYRLGDGPYVLAVGSLARHKNLEAVFAAMQLLGHQAWEYVIAGPVNPRIFGGVALDAPARAKQLGYVTDPELRALYEGAACLVYPSRYEGFGLPPLEAMACGCPVIVSRSASLPEVCGDAALYVDADDHQQLANAIRRVMCEPDLTARLRQLGRERARQWSWSRSADLLLSAVQGILAR